MSRYKVAYVINKKRRTSKLTSTVYILNINKLFFFIDNIKISKGLRLGIHTHDKNMNDSSRAERLEL